MIEVNLLPGAKKRSKRAKGISATSGLKAIKLPEFDRWLAFIVAAWVIGLGGLAWMFVGSRARAAELDEQIEVAVADSTRGRSATRSRRSSR